MSLEGLKRDLTLTMTSKLTTSGPRVLTESVVFIQVARQRNVFCRDPAAGAVSLEKSLVLALFFDWAIKFGNFTSAKTKI